MPKRSKNELNFTDSKLKNLKPTDKRVYFSDSGCPNLWMQLTQAGTKSFQAKGWSKKHQKRIHKTLGNFPDINLDTARELCRKFTGSLAEGHDLETERQLKRSEITCEEMFDKWLAEHGKDLRAGQESYNVWHNRTKMS